MCTRYMMRNNNPADTINLCDLQIDLAKGHVNLVDAFVSDSTPVLIRGVSARDDYIDAGTWANQRDYLGGHLRKRNVGRDERIASTEECMVVGQLDAVDYSMTTMLCRGEPIIGGVTSLLNTTLFGPVVLRRYDIAFKLVTRRPSAAETNNATVDIGKKWETELIESITEMIQQTDINTMNAAFTFLMHGGVRAFCEDLIVRCTGSFTFPASATLDARVQHCLDSLQNIRTLDLDGTPRTTGNSIACRMYEYFYGEPTARCNFLTAPLAGVSPCVD